MQLDLFGHTPPLEFWLDLAKRYNFERPDLVARQGNTEDNFIECAQYALSFGYTITVEEFASYMHESLWFSEEHLIEKFRQYLENKNH